MGGRDSERRDAGGRDREGADEEAVVVELHEVTSPRRPLPAVQGIRIHALLIQTRYTALVRREATPPHPPPPRLTP